MRGFGTSSGTSVAGDSALYYPTNDSENLGKLQPKADIGIFIGYAPTKKAFRIYNQRTRRIIETIHVDFDELTAMASEHSSSGPALHEMIPATISSGLVPNPPPVPPSRTDWDILFQSMFDELLTPSPSVDYPATEVIAPIHEVVALVPAVSTSSPSSTNVDQDAPSPSHSQTTPETQPLVIPNDVKEDNHDIVIANMGNDRYFGIPIPGIPSDQSSSSDSIHTIVHPDHQISKHNSKWTKDHPLENIIGELNRPVSTRLQLYEQALSLFLLIRSFPSVPFLSTPSSSPPPRRGNKGEIRGGIRGLGARERDKRELIRGWKESFALVSDCAGYKDFSPGIIQPDDFVDPDNPNHVYKLKKALYGLKQAYCRGSDEDKKRKSAVLNPSHYVTWIGTLLISQLVDLDATISLYARVERPGCARGESDADHDGLSDNAVAHLERYSQRDYGDRLVSWSSKRQKSATISSTKAKYIAMSGCCAQISVIGVIGESAARARALSGGIIKFNVNELTKGERYCLTNPATMVYNISRGRSLIGH
ncbi:retrovirus-related pol polyprotein from transposon TNT 1-94 [Tanacetum coccineum]